MRALADDGVDRLTIFLDALHEVLRELGRILRQACILDVSVERRKHVAIGALRLEERLKRGDA